MAELWGRDILNQNNFGQFIIADSIVVALMMSESVELLDRFTNIFPKPGCAQDQSDASGPIGPIIFINM